MAKQDNIVGHTSVGDSEPCLCGSDAAYSTCCKPLLSGDVEAISAEQLMRSRYTAYVLGNEEYLLKTWHTKTRPESLGLGTGASPTWLGLQVLGSTAGQAGDEEGVVEFCARYMLGKRIDEIQEVSRFLYEDGCWYYLDGEVNDSAVHDSVKVGRNEPCPCGSGKKFKRCCGK